MRPFRSFSPEPSPAGRPLDALVLTTSNERQARASEAQLRECRGIPSRNVMIVPDPAGMRVGSGGATLLSLEHLAELFGASRGEGFEHRRVLIVHSGGDSRRLPAYAAQGKIFVPTGMVDDTGRPRTLFDLIVRDLEPLVPPGRVVVATGDVYLNLAADSPDLGGADVVGVAIPSTLATGSRHGVYIAGRDGEVLEFLQKPPPTTQRERGAVRKGRVLVDTGVLSFSAPAVRRMLRAARRGASGPSLSRSLKEGKVTLDLYDAITTAMALRTRSRVEENLALAEFRRVIGTFALVVRESPHAGFLHLGSTGEVLSRLSRVRELTTINSDGVERVECRGRAVIDACSFGQRARLGGENLVVNVPAGLSSRVDLPRGFGLAYLPVGRSQWACLRFGTRDDFKCDIATARGRYSVLANLAARVRRGEISAARVFAGAAGRSLWDARLWPIGTLDHVTRGTIWLQESLGPIPREWYAERLSLPALLGRVNHARLATLRGDAAARSIVRDLPARLAADPPAPLSDWLEAVRDARTASFAAGILRQAVSGAVRPSLAAVAQLAASDLARKWPREARNAGSGTARTLEVAAFASVRASVSVNVRPAPRPTSPGILADQVIWVTCPARIDLAGGWSDTPPICADLGGTVVNASITLNGQYPIQVVCRLSDRLGIRITSIDLGRSVHLRNAGALRSFEDPTQWASLPKAALALSGLVPPEASTPLSRWLDGLGAGIDLTVFSALPKGSGLGGSSILGAAVLAALGRLTGRPLGTDALIRQTSLLEQVMSTGGGWQDQAGGVTAGVKIITTRPGEDQIPTIRAIPVEATLSNPEVAPLLLLYYTGQRRLARNILRNVVSRYLRRDREALAVIGRLKEGASHMAEALRAGSLDGFVRRLNEYWQLKCTLDPGTTNPLIEGIRGRVLPHLDACCLPGAGGGGFVFMLAKSRRHARRVRDMLADRPPNRLARFYDFALDPRGLGMSVL